MKRLLTYILPFLLFVITSCDHEKELPDIITSGSDSVSLTLNVLLPAQSVPKTYAISEDAESRIDNMDVLAFIIDADDNTEKFAYRREGVLTNDNGSEKIFKLTVLKSKENYRFVFIANAKQQLDQLGNIEKGTLKENILSRLIFKNSDKWETNSDSEFTPFPMWGESRPVVITTEMTDLSDINLTRMLARVDVALTTEEAKDVFQLESVYIFNRSTRGYIVPNTSEEYWEVMEETNIGKAKKATVPEDDDINDPLTVVEPVYYVKEPGADVCFFREIYTFEAAAPASGKPDEATCLVIGGIFNDDDKPTYYRIDFFGGR